MDQPTPAVHRVLRQACLYGYLIERNGSLYYPGGTQRVCSKALGSAVVQLGWLNQNFGRYEITPEGKRAEALVGRAKPSSA